jgi:dTDP-4-dehydrorhamnose 3,5-epimerase
MIDGVEIHPLKRFPDERGSVMHMLKSTDAHFRQFGEIYFSTVYPGVVKGWHIHERMTLNYCCVSGCIKMALYDERAASPTKGRTQVVYLGEKNYVLVVVPPGVWNGFMGVDVKESIVANCATHPHDPAEIRRLEPHRSHIPYDWARKDA